MQNSWHCDLHRNCLSTCTICAPLHCRPLLQVTLPEFMLPACDLRHNCQLHLAKWLMHKPYFVFPLLWQLLRCSGWLTVATAFSKLFSTASKVPQTIFTVFARKPKDQNAHHSNHSCKKFSGTNHICQRSSQGKNSKTYRLTRGQCFTAIR